MAYHHGDLATALVQAAVELARDGGPAAVTIREATRRAGVSPNAAYRHFPSRAALIDATAAAIQQGLAAAMTDAPDRSPAERLQRIGAAYVDFALDEPGWFAVVFFGIRPPDPATVREAPAFVALTAALDDLVAAGDLAAARRDDAAWACWATVHGFAELCLHGPLAGVERTEQRRRGGVAIRAVIAGIRSGDA
ncbi:TetR/AcrR family transcriptional regulator [Microbacterium sp. 13-71-7]|jgi:AcrR family transcriptional regulator|uniref:TetR/AcrR family transcriptional regulator n=1 Tax=Microbacterium sp. 13-71-7 TaxID=1970399 RepID=UPI000BCF6596|nr:TetR/AcrR family transcriptional regulator [Microbacterium sp. 13-71-7]OZB80319.1 MAG: TetR family transcriptional regulator [Microbacterium sp. 13-71-7]